MAIRESIGARLILGRLGDNLLGTEPSTSSPLNPIFQLFDLSADTPRQSATILQQTTGNGWGMAGLHVRSCSTWPGHGTHAVFSAPGLTLGAGVSDVGAAPAK